MERTQNSYPLLRQFREFYLEVARLRMKAQAKSADGEVSPDPAAKTPLAGQVPSSSGSAAAKTAGSSVALADDDDGPTLQIWQPMARYLDQKMYEVNLSASAISFDSSNELVYIMAAFADETFICLVDWPGKDYWRDHLMELRLFHSQIAGQEIFRRIDRLLARRDFVVDELAAIYLMVLALGFKGQHLRNPELVEVYREKLFDRLLMTNPDLRQDSQRLFPDAYRHTIVDGSPVRLPEPRTWWLAVAGIVTAWLVLSTIAWIALTHSTQQTLAVTMNSLNRVTSEQLEATVSDKWSSLPFSLAGGAYRAALPSVAPFNAPAAGSGAAVVAPLLIAVNTQGGKSGLLVPQIKAWLSRGSTSFLTNAGGLPLKARAIASIEFRQFPPAGITSSDSTLFFFVDPQVSAAELPYHPQLIFPSGGPASGEVTSVTLYLPQATNAGNQ